MNIGGVTYIMTNKNNTVLYVGVTSNIKVRVWQHKNKAFKNSFTARYNCNKLVYFKYFSNISEAILFEKKLKGGNRMAKIKLIEAMNPLWNDLSESID